MQRGEAASIGYQAERGAKSVKKKYTINVLSHKVGVFLRKIVVH